MKLEMSDYQQSVQSARSRERGSSPGHEAFWIKRGAPVHRWSRDRLRNLGFFGGSLLGPLEFPVQTARELVERGPAHLMEPDQFQHPFVGPLSGEQLQQQGGDQR